MKNRNFLFLQGPHGPFFDRLGAMLRKAGAGTWRVGFNAGDAAFWRDKASYLPYCGAPADWVEHFATLVSTYRITDLVLYGDTRAIHAQAITRAKSVGLTVHVFEEGYLRPFWVTYERDGSNGNSALMDTTVATMQADLERFQQEVFDAPTHWGDLRHHVFYGAAYHFFVMFLNNRYKGFQRHRELSVAAESKLYLKRFSLMPYYWAQRVLATWRIQRGGYPFHLALLQLEHDSSFREHSPFSTMTEFLDEVITGFATGAPGHHHLVFKAHPLESGQRDLRREVARLAEARACSGRVHFVRGGKLAQLLDHARSAVTVNSTAGQQALSRGIAVRLFGRAVYGKPEFVSDQPIEDFFAAPQRPDMKAYRAYRQYLLETSQIAGGFYAAKGRQQVLRVVVDMMLAAQDPYAALGAGQPTPRAYLRLAK